MQTEKMVVYGNFKVKGKEYCWKLPEGWKEEIVPRDFLIVESQKGLDQICVTRIEHAAEYPREDMACVVARKEKRITEERYEELLLGKPSWKQAQKEERRKRILYAYGISREPTAMERIYIDGYIHKWFHGFQFSEPVVMAAIQKSRNRVGYIDCMDTHKILTRWRRYGVKDKTLTGYKHSLKRGTE